MFWVNTGIRKKIYFIGKKSLLILIFIFIVTDNILFQVCLKIHFCHDYQVILTAVKIDRKIIFNHNKEVCFPRYQVCHHCFKAISINYMIVNKSTSVSLSSPIFREKSTYLSTLNTLNTIFKAIMLDQNYSWIVITSCDTWTISTSSIEG